jgi:hypothetical protein
MNMDPLNIAAPPAVAVDAPAPIVAPPVAPVVVQPPAAPPAPPVAAKPETPAPATPVRVLNPWAKKEAAAPMDPRVAALETRATELSATLAGYAQTELSASPENIRNAVRAIAGDDPSAQLKALAALRANGVTALPTIAAGSTTAPPVAAPAPSPANDPDVLALTQYERLVASGSQILASQFAARNQAAIARATAARASRN